MRILHIVGRKNHGKTTLTVDLIKALRQRGLVIGAVKHSMDALELDTPGKDTYRHREAGASPVALVSETGITLFLQRRNNLYKQIEATFAGCDLVLIEGNVSGPGPKIEVWRADVGGTPIAAENSGILGIVTDDPLNAAVPIWPRSNVSLVAEQVLRLAREV